MKFLPERLIQVRTSLNINKSEAARRLNISAMAYGRYERGEHEPSYQYVCHIARTFQCNVDFLYGLSDTMEASSIEVTSGESPELFEIVSTLQHNPQFMDRVLAYVRKLELDELKSHLG